jgi:hypothetical protein
MAKTVSKMCAVCKKDLPFDRFHRLGRNGHQAYCKDCRRLRDATLYRKNVQRIVAQKRALQAKRREWHWKMKEGQPCSDCGGSFHPVAMQWDHPEGSEKKGNVATMLQRVSRRRFLEELEKCELVCANCHAVRSFNRVQQKYGSRK